MALHVSSNTLVQVLYSIGDQGAEVGLEGRNRFEPQILDGVADANVASIRRVLAADVAHSNKLYWLASPTTDFFGVNTCTQTGIQQGLRRSLKLRASRRMVRYKSKLNIFHILCTEMLVIS